MSNYTKATNFAAKDALSTSDPAKIIKGTDIDNEFNAISSAVSSKADTNSPTLTGTPLAPTAASGTNTTQIATTAFVTAATGNATNIAGGAANRIVYQTALDTTGFAVAPTSAGTYLGWTGSAFAWSTVSASTSAALTMNNGGAGDSSGATFNGSIAKTISYNTIGAPSTSGTGATGTWGISITGSSGSTSYATSAGTAAACTGNAATVTNGVYTNANNSLSGTNTFTGTIYVGANTLCPIVQSSSGVIALGASLVSSAAATVPQSNNTASLGIAGLRWSEVFATNGTINTSDANQKQDITTLDDAEKRVALRIKGQIKKFKFKDAVAQKGNAARIHVGVIAQEVGDAFRAEGLDPNRYGMFCYDVWEAKPATLDANGNVLVAALAAGSSYGVRYDELYAFILAAI
jgi:hypothetical protein